MRIVIALLMLLFSIEAQTAKGTLYVGIDPGNPPFVFQISAQPDFSGFDIDLINEICKRLDYICIFRPMSFKSLFTSLLSNDIQIAIGAISITEARMKHFVFTLPYMENSTNFITMNNSPLTDVKDLYGKKIGIEEGSILRQYLKTTFSDKVTVVEVPDLPAVLEGLKNKKIDAAIIDSVTIKFWQNNNFADIKVLGQPVKLGLGYGIMSTPPYIQLMHQINHALMNMEDDGAYLAIYQRYLTN